MVSQPSDALHKMCNFIAIAETKDHSEILRKLILHLLHTFPEEKLSETRGVGVILKTIFGIEVPQHQIEDSLKKLISSNQIDKPAGMNYTLSPETRIEVKARVEDALQLQERVKNQWLAENSKLFNTLDTDLAWGVILEYLAKVFLRHGIQVNVFLDPSSEQQGMEESLSTLLQEAVQNKFSSVDQRAAEDTIAVFFRTVGENPERAQFISQCADGATNYFSLGISPEMSSRFRDKLEPLVLLCDTNFLFGILDLHEHHLVKISNELLDAITKHSLPIKLRYHEETLAEFHSSIGHYEDNLCSDKYKQSLSRIVATTNLMSGPELKYHQKNSKTKIEVKDFFKPYKHADILLRKYKLEIFRSSDSRLEERATLEADYKEFLESSKKPPKSHGQIAHDMIVLDCVRCLRSNAKSTLGPSALFVTCDHTLYRFDREMSRKEKTPASVVLPNILWQVLRPCIPSSSHDFDKSFAETFAIPEFRTIGSGSSKACSRLLSLLNTYDNFPEETAGKLLANDMLMEKLSQIENDKQFQTEVNLAIKDDHKTLIEDVAIRDQKIEEIQSNNEKINKELVEVTKMEANKTEQALEAERKTKTEALFEKKIFCGITAILINIILFLVIHKVWRWDWLLSHHNSYGLQACIYSIVLLSILGFIKPWRKLFWVPLTLLLPLVFQMLGGPKVSIDD